MRVLEQVLGLGDGRERQAERLALIHPFLLVHPCEDFGYDRDDARACFDALRIGLE